MRTQHAGRTAQREACSQCRLRVDCCFAGWLVGSDSQCHDECANIASIDSHTCVPPLNETALLLAITVQPIAVAIEADQSVFQHYTGGVIDDPKCGQQLDHAVLLIGYGTDSTTGQPYYIVKNSWGAGWGIGGYALVARNKNMCGIASEPVMPIIKADKQSKAE